MSWKAGDRSVMWSCFHFTILKTGVKSLLCKQEHNLSKVVWPRSYNSHCRAKLCFLPFQMINAFCFLYFVSLVQEKKMYSTRGFVSVLSYSPVNPGRY